MNRLHSNSLLSLLLLCYAALFMLSVAMVLVGPVGGSDNRSPLQCIKRSASAQLKSLWSYAVNEGVIIRTEDVVTEEVGDPNVKQLPAVFLRSVTYQLIFCRSSIVVLSNQTVWPSHPSSQSYWSIFLIVMASMIQQWYLLPLDLITVTLSHSMVLFSLS